MLESGRHPRLERRGTLAARHHIPARLAGPGVPRFGESLRQLVRVEALPIAEEDLAQLLHRSGLDTQRRGDRSCGLAGAKQVTCVQRLDLPACQSPRHTARLLISLLGQRRIKLALDAALAIPGRLAVADEDQPRGWWSTLSGPGTLRHSARRRRTISAWLCWREI